MTELNTTSDQSSLAVLHERVNAMLDVPLPKEGDAWPLPIEASIAEETFHETDNK